MNEVTIKEKILRELDNLPREQQKDVLNFVRFLKIGMADRDEIEQQFVYAVNKIRLQVREREISDQDIEGEINAVRSEK